MDYYCIATNIGAAAASNAILTGTKVNVTTFAVGDGGGSEYAPTPDMTALRNEVWRGVVTNAEIDEENPNVINYTTLIPYNVGGFVMREMAILDDEGLMIGIGNMASTPKVRFEQGIDDETELTFSLTIASPSAMKWQVDPTVILATKKNIQDHNASEAAHPFLLSKLIGDILAHNTSESSHPFLLSKFTDVYEQLTNKVNKTPPQEYKLQLSTGYSDIRNSSYCKTQEGIVVLNMDIKKDTGTIASNEIVATLPVGFRPTSSLELVAAFHSPFFASRVAIAASTGTIVARLDTNTASVLSVSCCFVASQ